MGDNKKKKKSKGKFNYFKSFEKMSRYAVQAAAILDDAITNYNLEEVFQERISDMKHVEHKCDEVMYGIMDHIVKDFLPPIDQEDIIRIGYAIDDVTDAIDDVFTFMYMYHIDHLRPDFIELAQVLLQCTEGLEAATSEFSNFKKTKRLKERVMTVSDLEKKADRIFEDSVYNLFGEEDLPTRELIVWHDLYQRLEDCCDAAESVAKIMETVQLKNL